MKNLAFGIDFGTTNSIVCAWGDSVSAHERQPVAFWESSQQGLRPHPSVVWYGPQDIPQVGREARDHIGGQATSMGHVFVSSIKRKLGRDQEIELIGGTRKAAWEVASEIFRYLRDHAHAGPLKTGNQKLEEAVVTVPVDFDGRQRRDIRRAMQKAGIKLQAFLHEPFAAMVSHFYDRDKKLASAAGKRTLVFDWGGGTLDICITEVSDDAMHVFEVAHDGIADRAGDEFDQRLMRLLKQKCLGKSGVKIDDIPLTGHASDRLRIAAENSKIALSTASERRVEVPGLFEAFGKLHDLEENITRPEFETVITPEIQAAEACVLRCLKKANLTAGLIDHVLMVGGTSNVPAVRSMMERVFGARVTIAHEPDAAIARGAAIVAAEGWIPYNVNNVGVLLADETLFTILPERLPLLPSESKKHSFYCVDPRDGIARLQLATRLRHGDEAIRTLGDCLAVKSPPTIRAVNSLDRINAKFVVTEDATLHVTARSAATGDTQQAEIHDLCFGLKIG